MTHDDKHLYADVLRIYASACMLCLACMLALAATLALASLVFPAQAHAEGQKTLMDVYGVSRAEVVRWLQSHEHDTYYLGTPYRPYDWRSPNGDINNYGKDSDGTSAGMNCTGFVWHALCAAHGWRDGIDQKLPALSGWREAIENEDLLTYSFSSKQAMLSSGVLEKGDIIWMWEGGDSSVLSDNHHIVIFWGNRPDEDLAWHSSGDANNNWVGENAETDIHGKADLVTYQVIKLGGNLTGAFSLKKTSALPDITSGNSNYTLQGALYGLFSTRQKAATHSSAQALRTFSTDRSGSYTSASDVIAGTYYVAEITPPRGYALDNATYEVVVEFDKVGIVNAAHGSVSDVPITNPVDLWAEKLDAETNEDEPQGSATLAGTRFEISYYAGYYGQVSGLPSPTRTWIVETDENGKAWARESLKASDSRFYLTASGQITLPLGTVTVREVAPPNGYLPADGRGEDAIRLYLITADGVTPLVERYEAPVFHNRVIRGGVSVGKIDRQNGQYLPQGAATLAGAEFSIASLNAHPVLVDGQLFNEGETVATLRTGQDDAGRFTASTSTDCLPYGSYEVRETASSEGYRYDEISSTWSQIFQITEEGTIVDLAEPNDAAPNMVIRGDISFSKADGTTGKRLGSIPFLITSMTTGERHIIVSDENGMASTAGTWLSREASLNANDLALIETQEGLAAEYDLLDTASGVWFNGRTDVGCAADDAIGALPYDTYQVDELRCDANEGYELTSFTVRISRDERELDLGTVDDNDLPEEETAEVPPAAEEENVATSQTESLPKTFDGIPMLPIALLLAFACAVSIVARANAHIEKQKTIVIERGRERRC